MKVDIKNTFIYSMRELPQLCFELAHNFWYITETIKNELYDRPSILGHKFLGPFPVHVRKHFEEKKNICPNG